MALPHDLRTDPLNRSDVDHVMENFEYLAFLSSTATYNPPSLVAGAQTTTTIAVTGAALGDHTLPSFSLDLQGMQLTAYVSAVDTVTCVLRNGTAGTLDLASGTLAAIVFKR